jgi:hypothetical protein
MLNCMKNIRTNHVLYLFQLIAHIFINNYLLPRSNFSYMLRPEEAMFRKNTDIFLYISVFPEHDLYRPKRLVAITTYSY